MGRVLKYKNVEILRKELVVLKNVNFSIQEGEFVYMIGKVGSGKSSLLKSMYAEIPVSAGDATVLGFDLQSLKGKQVPLLRRAMGIVFQDFQLLTDRSVYDNLHFVLRATGWRNEAEIKERIAQTLQKVGMSNKSYKMPHELSGGEQQRVVIARALLNNPKLILADEPTGNLDINAGTQIVELLRSIAANGTAVIMATHNVQFLADYPARTLCCKDKRLFELTADDDHQEATDKPQQSEATPAREPEHSKYESYMPATPLDATPAEIAPGSVAEPMDGSHSKETKQE